VTISVFGIVLLAALLHAGWNAMVKASPDRALTLGWISFGHVVLGAFLVPFVPIPAIESWPFIAISTFVHWAYYLMLFHSYRLGDLSRVYPISRGAAPVLVALGAQFFVGEILPLGAWLGVLSVSAGIILLSKETNPSKSSVGATLAALATGVCIALYSIADGMGARAAHSAIGYVAWLFLCEIFVTGYIFYKRRGDMFKQDSSVWRNGAVGGVVSACAYGLVIYAKSLTLLALVSTLRETSVIFAALIGIFLFGERPWKLRVLASSIVLVGVVIMALTA
jgi:drug/metabolite transporter (DMT)-like permease